MQDSPAAAFGPVGVVAGDFVPHARGGPDDISANTAGAPHATSVDSPSRSADTPDQKRSSADDNPSGVCSGMRGGYKPVAEDDSGSVRRPADSSGNGECSSSSSGREWKGSFSPEAPINLNVPAQRIHLYQWCCNRFPQSSMAARPRCIGLYRYSKGSRLCGVMLLTRSTRSSG